MQKHGDVLGLGAFDSLKPLVQTACDLLYTRKYEEMFEDGNGQVSMCMGEDGNVEYCSGCRRS